jgi:FMN reductase
MKIVGVSGSHSRPSKSHLALELVAARAAERLGGKARCFDLLDAGPELGRTFSRASARPEHEEMWQAVLDCDLLVVGGPVYKGSYTGLFKHFFDLFDRESLAGKMVLLSAMGGGQHHALMIEHQLRPLFGFFSAHTLPKGLFFTAGALTGTDPVCLTDAALAEVDAAIGPVQWLADRGPSRSIEAAGR